ncbi:MAG TPA: GDSL-type esterase/lipase family protein [Patescibacteria group bacterium]|nr:GDSL-type esterase/lipase family protein [Patescibacteria group bacterium]
MCKKVLAMALICLAAVAAFGGQPLQSAAKQSSRIFDSWANSLVRKPNDPQYLSFHYRVRTLYFSLKPSGAQPVVFLGDSITYGANWNRLFPDLDVENRGIGGDSSLGVLNRLDQVITLHPTQIFLMIGTNDLCYGRSIPEIAANYRMILERLKVGLPECQIYVESVLPFNDEIFPSRRLRTNENIRRLNDEVRQVASDYKCPYVDLATAFTDIGGRLPARYTDDGLHLNETAYLVWRDQIRNLAGAYAGRAQ